MAALREAGCVAADEEAAELLEASGGSGARLSALIERRRAGEPLAWLTGSVRFCGIRLLVRPGVYVPRWQSEPLAAEAARRLPDGGLAVDLCTGSGAVAAVLARRRPAARVLATELDPVAVACARANGVEVFEGDLDGPLPAGLGGHVDLVVGVVPYVPTVALHQLPRDVLAYEPRRALDGGPGGTEVLVRAVAAAARLLRPGGSLLLELAAGQPPLLAGELDRGGFRAPVSICDGDGELRGIACRSIPA